MEDYESQYEEYKNTLLHNRYFRGKLNDQYRGSLSAEKDYIDTNGILWKTSALAGACASCFVFLSLLEDRTDTTSIIIRIVLVAIMIVCCILGVRVAAKFKKDLGELIFYSFRYHKYFQERIQEDKRREMERFDVELHKTVSFMQRCANDPRDDLTEVVAEFRCALQYVEELEKQYKHISNYDRFAGSLKNDYCFNAEIQKDIDKYI